MPNWLHDTAHYALHSWFSLLERVHAILHSDMVLGGNTEHLQYRYYIFFLTRPGYSNQYLRLVNPSTKNSIFVEASCQCFSFSRSSARFAATWLWFLYLVFWRRNYGTEYRTNDNNRGIGANFSVPLLPGPLMVDHDVAQKGTEYEICGL